MYYDKITYFNCKTITEYSLIPRLLGASNHKRNEANYRQAYIHTTENSPQWHIYVPHSAIVQHVMSSQKEWLCFIMGRLTNLTGRHCMQLTPQHKHGDIANMKATKQFTRLQMSSVATMAFTIDFYNCSPKKEGQDLQKNCFCVCSCFEKNIWQ